MSRHVPRFTTTTDDTGRPVVTCAIPGCGEQTATTNPTGIAAWKRAHVRAAQAPNIPIQKKETA